jgi:hypothetical protein
MDVAEDLRLHAGVEAVRELREPLMQVMPKRHAPSDGERHLDRAERGNVFVANAALGSAGLNEAHLKPALGLAEPNEHRSGRSDRKLRESMPLHDTAWPPLTASAAAPAASRYSPRSGEPRRG